jgi:hypothetical protein
MIVDGWVRPLRIVELLRIVGQVLRAEVLRYGHVPRVGARDNDIDDGIDDVGCHCQENRVSTIGPVELIAPIARSAGRAVLASEIGDDPAHTRPAIRRASGSSRLRYWLRSSRCIRRDMHDALTDDAGSRNNRRRERSACEAAHERWCGNATEQHDERDNEQRAAAQDALEETATSAVPLPERAFWLSRAIFRWWWRRIRVWWRLHDGLISAKINDKSMNHRYCTINENGEIALMQKNDDGSVTFSDEEFRSLGKLVGRCYDRISRLVDDVDFLGVVDHYYALQMWGEKLKGKLDKWTLNDFVDDGKPRKEKTVDEWLASYGRKK